jgi:prepilin-type N-terminal cleavage/methylation domain-containing protein
MKNKGFTMVELLVVVVVFGIILITISTILINTVKAKNRTAIIQELENTGNMTLERIKYNLLNAQQGTFDCPVGGVGSSLSFVDKAGAGDRTVIDCFENSQIASRSASVPTNEFVYNSDSVIPMGCNGFVTCTMSGTDVLSVGISFNLRAGAAGAPVDVGVSRAFQTSVTIRK